MWRRRPVAVNIYVSGLGALIGLTRTKIGWMVVRYEGLGGYRVTRS